MIQLDPPVQRVSPPDHPACTDQPMHAEPRATRLQRRAMTAASPPGDTSSWLFVKLGSRASAGNALIHRPDGWLGSILRAVLAMVLVNAPFWALGTFSFISRPLFNLELALPLLLLGWSVPVSLGCLAVLWVADNFVAHAATFYFASPLEFFQSVRFATALSLGDFVTSELLAWLLVFCVVCAAVVRTRVVGMRPLVAVTALTVGLAALDIENGSSMFSEKPTWAANINIAGSPIFKLGVSSLCCNSQSTALSALPDGDSARSVVDVVAWAQAHPTRSVVFVLVESMGDSLNPRLQAWLTGQLWTDEVSKSYSLAQGHAKFRGNTTFGELRELCGLNGSFRHIDADNAKNCIPNQLSRMGWQTTGLHGFAQAMFARAEWWPELGLKRQLFAEQLLAPEQAHCGGAFAGVCDVDLLARAFEIARRHRQFTYALTLNSHLPLNEMDVPTDLEQICALEHLERPVCLLTAVLGRVMAAARAGVLATDRAAQPLVVLVGDHAPAFGRTGLRLGYSQTQVPVLALMPKT